MLIQTSGTSAFVSLEASSSEYYKRRTLSTKVIQHSSSSTQPAASDKFGKMAVCPFQALDVLTG